MLAMLAVAPPRGLTSDRVVALLWPEVEGRHARHRLAQLRYALRRGLRVDPIIGTTDLRLDASIVLTDVQRFNEALAQGDFEQAVRLVQEPYLDGFYLRQSREFERWVDEVRWEIERKVENALERLAAAADERGDVGGMAHWLEQIVRRDPVNEAAAVSALEAYEVAGDYAHARHFGEWLQRTLREEYEVVPEATLKAAIDRMRTDRRAVVHNLPRRSGNISVRVIGGAELESDPIPKKSVCPAQGQPKFDPVPYVAALLLVGAALALAWGLEPWIGVESVDLVFLTAIVGIAARYGLLPSLSASVAAWFCYNFFFLPPIFELNIPGPTDTAAFLTFTIVAVVVSKMKSARRTI